MAYHKLYRWLQPAVDGCDWGQFGTPHYENRAGATAMGYCRHPRINLNSADDVTTDGHG
jgi:hypothetical protein